MGVKWMENISEALIHWVKVQMETIGAKNAVVGISGGKDSAVVAGLMAKAIGKERVYGVMMPDGEQSDISYARELCDFLGIHQKELSIKGVTDAYWSLMREVEGTWCQEMSQQTRLNLPPRVRMTLLYALAQSLDAVVINTSNLSEDWVGYATIYGDTAGAFSPLGQLTTEEVIALGRTLGLSEKFLVKAPSDGLTGKTDEEVLGFSYPLLNRYLREGICEDPAIKERIDKLHRQSRFKFLPIPMFEAPYDILAEDIAHIYDTKSHQFITSGFFFYLIR